MIDVKLEKISGHAKDGIVGKISVKINDVINQGDELLQIESKKGSSPIKSDFTGKVVSIEVEEGQNVKLGDVLFKLEGESTNNKKDSTTGTFDYFSGILKPKKEEIQCDVTIIGGGPGGYVAAIQAAKKGLKVVIIEKENVGGTCLNWGCIPTKALVRSSEVFKNMKNAEEFGLFAEKISVNIEKVIDRKNNIKEQLVQGIEYLLDKHDIKKISGVGEIINNETVHVKTKRVETTIITKNIIISTGSETSNVPIEGIESKYVMTSKEALDIKSLPKKLVIVGGGIIGMEFAFIFANFGVEVFVVEFADRILCTLDQDVSEEITEAAIESGIKIYTSAKVGAITESESDDCIISFTKDNKKMYVSADKVLVAIGRQPYFEGLGIENLGIEMNDKKKGIKVNDYMQTNIPNIYAIGDVTNKIQLAHVASHQGIVAVDNILGLNKKMSYEVVPSAVFTDPEIAIVGISEKQAIEQGMDFEIGKFPFAANGKALTLGEKRGFVKILKDNTTGKIIGSAIVGAHATDLLAVVTLAIKNELTTEEITETIFAHPTTAEAIHEASLEVEGGAIHFVK